MEWPRAKTILIIMLLAVNVFLFCIYANKSMEQSRNEEQVREQICSVMHSLGYELSGSVLPRDSQLYYPARITRSTKSERTAMAAALDNITVENSIGVTEYTGKKGEVTLRSGGYIQAKLALSDAEMKNTDTLKFLTGKLKELRVDIISAAVGENGVVKGTCAAAGKPIFNCTVECILTDKQLSVTGRIPMGEVSFIQNITPRAVSGLMLNFAQHVKSLGITSGKIEAIEPGYTVSSPTEFESGVTELVPVWRVRMNGNDWYVNALTGKVVSLEQ